MTSSLPSNLPAITDARLPKTYEAATHALAECSRIDECQDWADKAEALASYARQARNNELREMADRIQARAVRREGELLKTFQIGPKGGRPEKNGVGTRTVSQRRAAEEAGLSKHQELTAVRVANVPKEEFEAAVESEHPPTVSALANRGRRPQPTVKDPDREFRRVLEPVHRLLNERRSYESLILTITKDSKRDFCREIKTLIRALNQWLKELKGDL
jgi:hypothetical protein